jgi:hypothetical protein
MAEAMGVLGASSFSVLRETPMAFFYDYFKKLNCCSPAKFNAGFKGMKKSG